MKWKHASFNLKQHSTWTVDRFSFVLLSLSSWYVFFPFSSLIWVFHSFLILLSLLFLCYLYIIIKLEKETHVPFISLTLVPQPWTRFFCFFHFGFSRFLLFHFVTLKKPKQKNGRNEPEKKIRKRSKIPRIRWKKCNAVRKKKRQL